MSVAATDASAAEFPLDPGTFTLTRTGGTAIELPVVFELAGSALNGVAYQALPAQWVIPAGSSTATLTVMPIPNQLAEGDRLAALSLTATPAYNRAAAAGASATITIHDKPADAWRFAHFGAQANDPAAADAADWDGDGLTNLEEFALALDPKVPGRAGLPEAAKSAGYFTLSFLPNPAAIDVLFLVEGSAELGSWSVTRAQQLLLVDPQPPGLRVYRYVDPINVAPRGFLRLRLDRLDL